MRCFRFGDSNARARSLCTRKDTIDTLGGIYNLVHKPEDYAR